ncbi:MAG: phosphatidylglycerol lysyltransferase domain-containing protein [Sulfuricellaceae bacterium]|nr:phosphatidylglycerol lysyltransferase domain-containing protein [Sulfuricellaceae bacterium]
MADESALSGLRSLSLDDLTRYKAVVNQSQRICWQHYFPFLFFASRKDNNEFLISEESGSVCIYWLRQEDVGPRLHLFLLPMPMNVAVLKSSLARCRDFNHSKRATVRLVDEEDIGVGASIEGASMVLMCSEYLYDPKFYRSMSGGKTRELRHNLAKVSALGDVEVRPYAPEDAAACLILLDEWWELQKSKHEAFSYGRYTKTCLKRAAEFDPSDLFGKVVLVNGNIRSFGFAGEMRKGLGNLFITYSDHTIKGLHHFLICRLLANMEGCELVNSSRADTAGVQHAKEALSPISMHQVYRIHQSST